MGYLAHSSRILVKKLQAGIDNLQVNPDREPSQTNPFYPQNKGIGYLVLSINHAELKKECTISVSCDPV